MSRILVVLWSQMGIVFAGIAVFLGIAWMEGQSGLHPIVAGAVALALLFVPYFVRLEKWL